MTGDRIVGSIREGRRLREVSQGRNPKGVGAWKRDGRGEGKGRARGRGSFRYSPDMVSRSREGFGTSGKNGKNEE